LGAWGDEYDHLGEVCESSKQSKGEEISIILALGNTILRKLKFNTHKVGE